MFTVWVLHASLNGAKVAKNGTFEWGLAETVTPPNTTFETTFEYNTGFKKYSKVA